MKTLKLGEKQRLVIEKRTDFGVYLTAKRDNFAEKTKKDEAGFDAKPAERVLLPKKEVPNGAAVGDEIEVFLYRDSDDRPIATTKTPYLTLGNFAALAVKDVTKLGAFLDWGLEKDLFLPYKEMQGRPRPGDTVLARLYLDKSGRLAASMRGLYPLLRKNAPYRAGDTVSARIYEFGHDTERDFGTYAAVDDRYSAMIPKHEDTSKYRIGDVVQARVTGVKEDGKLDLSLRKKAYEQMDDDAAKILELLESYAGVLPFTEKASPEVISRETGLSKNAFKRAVGRLYKERKISLEDGKIRLA